MTDDTRELNELVAQLAEMLAAVMDSSTPYLIAHAQDARDIARLARASTPPSAPAGEVIEEAIDAAEERRLSGAPAGEEGPRHCCGVMGFDAWQGDVCPACHPTPAPDAVPVGAGDADVAAVREGYANDFDVLRLKVRWLHAAARPEEEAAAAAFHDDVILLAARIWARDQRLAQRLADAEREGDELRADIEHYHLGGTARVCEQPACRAAVIRADSGARVCSAGHRARWVEIAELDAAQQEAARLRERVEYWRKAWHEQRAITTLRSEHWGELSQFRALAGRAKAVINTKHGSTGKYKLALIDLALDLAALATAQEGA